MHNTNIKFNYRQSNIMFTITTKVLLIIIKNIHSNIKHKTYDLITLSFYIRTMEFTRIKKTTYTRQSARPLKAINHQHNHEKPIQNHRLRMQQHHKNNKKYIKQQISKDILSTTHETTMETTTFGPRGIGMGPVSKTTIKQSDMLNKRAIVCFGDGEIWVWCVCAWRCDRCNCRSMCKLVEAGMHSVRVHLHLVGFVIFVVRVVVVVLGCCVCAFDGSGDEFLIKVEIWNLPFVRCT